MKNLAFAVLVFCTFICAAYSFKCYECENDDRGVNYTLAQCEKDLRKVDCPANGNFTCTRSHYTTKRGDIKEARGCTKKQSCEEWVNVCKGPYEEMLVEGIKKCEVAFCCVSDGDIPCNSGYIASTVTSGFTGPTVSFDVMMIMLAVLCSLKLF